jgi:hypothetical protein
LHFFILIHFPGPWWGSSAVFQSIDGTSSEGWHPTSSCLGQKMDIVSLAQELDMLSAVLKEQPSNYTVQPLYASEGEEGRSVSKGTKFFDKVIVKLHYGT